MKQVILNLGQGQTQLKPSASAAEHTSSKTSIKRVPGLRQATRAYPLEVAERDGNIHKPGPTEFVSQFNSIWSKPHVNYIVIQCNNVR